LETAIALAIDAHRDQRERRGTPYIMHSLRIMMAVNTLPAKAAAILHDVVEDTPITLADLRAAGIPENVIAAVDALTKRRGEPYDLYLKRIEANRMARMVKVHDLRDNLRKERLDRITDKDLARMARYRMALKRLTRSKKGGRP
jgi:(p)ppGpp synthase/HD superfamily hydrolase